jgi:MFS family permease
VPRSGLLTPRFVLVCISGGLYFFSFSLPLSVLPIWVESELGGTSFQVGVSVGILGLSAAALRPVIGPVADRHGRRLLVISGAAIGAVHLALLAVVDTIPLIIGARLIGGLGEAAVFVGLASAIQDLTPDDRRGEAASYFSLTIYGSLAVAPALGNELVELTSFDAVWLIAAAFAATAAVVGVVAPGPPDPRPPKPARRRYIHPAAIGPGSVLFLGLVSYSGFLSFAAVHAEDVGISNPGTVFTLLAAVVISLRVVGAQVPDRLGPITTTRIALTINVVGLVVLGTWREPAGVYAATAILGVAQSFFFPALFILAVDRAPAEERSHAIGSFSMAFDLAFIAGGAFIGIVADLSDRPTGFLAVAVVSGVTLALSHRILGDVKPRERVVMAGPRSRR